MHRNAYILIFRRTLIDTLPLVMQHRIDLANNSMIPDKQLAQFLVYVYVCIAKADYHLVDEEVVTIIRKLKNNNKYKHLNTDDLLNHALMEHEKHSEEEIFENIAQYTQKICHSEEDKTLLIADLEDIVEADGIVKDLEMTMYRRIKKMLL